MKKFSFFLFALFFGKVVKAQTFTQDSQNISPSSKSIFNPEHKRNFSRKGDFFFHWGYNHSWYNKSDISFVGPSYKFQLKDVIAHDRQSAVSWAYLNPGLVSVPQYDIRFGYFIKDNYSISIGWDHMKYVVDIPQTVPIYGTIGATISRDNTPTGSSAGTYTGEPINLTKNILTYEHTDGFNYANVELERYDDIWVAPSGNTSLTLETGLGGGAFIPRSDVRLFTIGRNNHWNLAGYGFSAKMGLKFYVWKHFYLQNTSKLGYADLLKVHTTGYNDLDKASQHIKYLENMWVVGVQF